MRMRTVCSQTKNKLRWTSLSGRTSRLFSGGAEAFLIFDRCHTWQAGNLESGENVNVSGNVCASSLRVLQPAEGMRACHSDLFCWSRSSRFLSVRVPHETDCEDNDFSNGRICLLRPRSLPFIICLSRLRIPPLTSKAS